YVNGDNVKQWVADHRQGVFNRPAKTFAPAELMAASQAMNFDFAKAFSAKRGYPSIDTSSAQSIKKTINMREEAIWDGYFQQASTSDARANRLGRLIGSPLEKMMITPELMSAGGVSPTRQWDQLSNGEKWLVSPLRQRILEQSSLKERLKAETLG